MSYIALTDEPDLIVKKIKRAVTDSSGEVRAAVDKPAITNLLTMYSLLQDVPISELEERYAGKGYGAFKSDLAEVVVSAIEPIQRRYAELVADPSLTRAVLAEGAERARKVASAKMERVRDRMGLSYDGRARA
jgi:tryptophanyl-tRNA synthetase